VQAPLLPRVVRWAGMGWDDTADQERHRAEITTPSAHRSYTSGSQAMSWSKMPRSPSIRSDSIRMRP